MISYSIANSIIPLVIGLPLFASIAAVLLRTPAWRVCSSVVFACLQLLLVTYLLVSKQLALPYYYSLGGWGAPLGIDLVVDGLSLLMLLITATLVFFLTIYSTRYFKDTVKAERFWPLWWLLIAGLNAAFISADAFNIYVALEMIGLAAVALVGLSGTRTALSAALRYALVGLLGSLCYLLGVALLYRSYGTLDLAQLAVEVRDTPVVIASLALISIGLLLKTALLPLHFWLPLAHSSAPAPVSAALSALVVKASFYLLIRFWLDVLAPATTDLVLNFLGVLGAVAILWGCIAAFRTQRLKLLVAYSTVAQLGYLFLLFPLIANQHYSTAIGSIAFSAVVYFMLAHALAKGAMFLAAGEVQSFNGHDSIDKLKGLVRLQPLTVVTFAIAGISLIGLPPSGGFIAKWLLLNAAISEQAWFLVVVILLGGLLAALYIGRFLNVAFSEPAQDEVNNTTPSKAGSMAICGFSLAIFAVLLGFNAEWILNLLGDNVGPKFAMLGGT